MDCTFQPSRWRDVTSKGKAVLISTVSCTDTARQHPIFFLLKTNLQEGYIGVH